MTQEVELAQHGFPEARPKRRTTPRSHSARPAPVVRQPKLSSGQLLLATGGALLAAGAFGAMAGRLGRERPSPAVRLAACGAGLLAASVLADSAMEHYRGNFKKRSMYVAPTASALTVAAGVATAVSPGAARLRGVVFAGALLTGLVGTGFHIKNVLDRPGGLSFNNLFYRAPLGAPGALSIAGALGIGALAADPRSELFVGEDRAGRALAAITAGGLAGLTAEVGLLHFRGAFHNPLMYVPVAGVPVTALSLASIAGGSRSARPTTARQLLGMTTALGVIGTGLHAYGVSRNMGGFKNWTQNLFQGPPIAAPPSLAGLALGGFAALRLLRCRESSR